MTIPSRILRSSRQPTLRCLLLVSSLVVASPSPARAQDPSHHYLTITTRHFRVTFTAPLEPLARRVAANAERAYAQLSAELHPPRGTIDVLISDDVDFSNGSATPTPSNRIIIYATPPVSENGLRFTTDWAQLVVTHELTHIFHLDRSRGVWRLAQYVFGRSPFLFPNSYSPSWLVEGLAVYEESHLAGEGRIEAPEHTMLVRTAAAAGEFPSIGDASLALPTFPLGNAAYAYGSLFMDYLARTRGDSAVRNFVESSSAQIIPYLIDIPSRRAFGTTFTRAWSEWRKSVEAVTPLRRAPIDGWRPLTGDGLVVSSPRWRGDSAITFTGTNGKQAFGAFQVSLDGRESRLSRRNSVSPTVDLPDGSQLFSQLELTGPYTERSDLFVQRGGRQQRLTRNARLFTPDARADGSIVATQIVQGASRLVRVSVDGSAIAPITAAAFDTLWSEPRWSDRGDRIVAVRWFRGGVSQVVVIDTLGAVERVVTSGRFTAAAPSWIPGDSGVAYTVGDGARNDIYLQYFRDTVATYRLVRSDFGGFEPQLESRHSSGGSLTAAVALRADGYRLELADAASTARIRQPVAAALDVAPDPRLPALAIDSSRATEFHALRTLIPRFWVPLFEAGMGQGTYRVGGYTQGWDILHRHNVYGELRLPTDDSGIDALAEYEYRGFGLPIVTVDASQDWTSFANIVTNASPPVLLGTIRRRIRDGEVLATVVRRRVRSSSSLSVGVGQERREYLSVPGTLLPTLDTAGDFLAADFPRVMLSSTFATYQSPPFSISPEDGFSVAATARERLRSGFSARGGSSLSLVGSLAGYKSLDLPGYAHHVVAVRASGGWADTRTGGYYEVGGTGGGTFEIIPGYTIGEGRQTFPVRGFPSASLIGIRAVSGSAEYRAPLSLAHRSLGLLPAFFNRTAATLFGDYGMAWCPNTAADRQVCSDTALQQRIDIASVGAELSLDAGLLSWDEPYRFRLGVALPVRNRDLAGARRFSVYLTSGLSF